MSQAEIKIEGFVQSNTELTPEQMERLILAITDVGLTDVAVVTGDGIRFSFEGPRTSDRTANNFAFAEKVGYIAQQAGATGLNLTGEVKLIGYTATENVMTFKFKGQQVFVDVVSENYSFMNKSNVLIEVHENRALVR